MKNNEKTAEKWNPAVIAKRYDSIGKPSSVACDHLSSPAVAGGVKPPFNGARRADALFSAPIGVASGKVYMAARSPAPRWALASPFHPYSQRLRYISVALALRSPSADVISYPALWCSDFPHDALAPRGHIMKSQTLLYHIISKIASIFFFFGGKAPIFPIDLSN